VIISVSTLFMLLAQMLWGIASDHAKSKVTVVQILVAGCMLVSLLFYVSVDYWFLLIAVTLYTCFFTGINPLIDNIALELSEGKSWSFGAVRAGGTVGYCVTVALAGWIIQDSYLRVFGMTAAACFLCLLVSARVPPVPGHRTERQKTPFRVLLRNKPLMTVIGFGLVYSLGMNYFYNYYPIYFTSIGGSSGDIGIMMFFCAVMEIPSLMVAERVVTRFGVDKVLVGAGLIASIRWFLLFLLRDPIAIICANLLHGVSYVGISYSIITFINRQVPRDLRATGQSFYVFLSNIFARLLFGYIGGLASEYLGANHTMLIVCCTLLVATLLFHLWSGKNRASFLTAKGNR
jgi:PPP family 3-phenylpropionic acid transporter